MTDRSSPVEPPATPAPDARAGPADGPIAGLPDVVVQRGAIGALQADEVVVSVGAIGAARAQRVSVEFGAIGAVAAREIRLTQGAAGTVAALEARIEQAVVRSVIARDVHFARGSGAAVVIAARVDGDARIMLDWRGGLAAGAVLESGLARPPPAPLTARGYNRRSVGRHPRDWFHGTRPVWSRRLGDRSVRAPHERARDPGGAARCRAGGSRRGR